MTRVHPAWLDAFRPSLIPVEANLTIAVFPLMKIFPAEFCVRHALEHGAISSDFLVVETSSGTMAYGLAIVCNWRRIRLTIVTDYACDPVLRRRLEELGARVEIVEGPAACGGYQRARLDRLQQIRADVPRSWWLNQYDNPGNGASYARFASQLMESLGRIDCLVGTVGSGGSVCGTSRRLREACPELTVVGVDTFGSVLFGQPDRPRQLRGLGNSLLPRNLDHTAFDEIHWVSAAEAYLATRTLHRETCLLRGGTTGAAWMVARHWARRHPGATVVCISPDDGHRYVNTLYDDSYLESHDLLLAGLPEEPIEVSHPLEAGSRWSWFRWGRRSYEQVLTGAAPAADAAAAAMTGAERS